MIKFKMNRPMTDGGAVAMVAMFGGCLMMVLLYAAALPLGLLWAINVLGIAVIDITWKSWAATFIILTVLQGVFGRRSSVS